MIHKNSIEKLSCLAKMCKKNNLKVAIECGGTFNPPWGDQAGENSAKAELDIIDKWCEAGGTVDFLDFDGPVRRLIDPNFRNLFFAESISISDILNSFLNKNPLPNNPNP